MKKFAAIVSVFVLALALAGCSGGSLSVDSDDGGVHAVAQGTAEGEGNGHITIGKKEGLCINHIVNKGSFHVKVVASDGTVVFDQDIADNIADMRDIQGEFDVWITANNAEGTVDIIPYDKEAQAQAASSLDESLKQATGKTAEELGASKSTSEEK